MHIEDVLTIEQADGVATLWIDHRLEPQNIISPAVIEVLATVFDRIEADDAVKAIVLISRKDNFIAGADIKAFAIEQPGAFRPIQALGHRALLRLERSAKPCVAAIHGACMGLGTELALACRGRIASNHPTTRLALPEVRLGLFPGGGGTQRLPRQVGIQRALDMMLTGRNVYAHQARKMGLVDDLVDRHKLHHAATVYATRLAAGDAPRSPRRSLMDRLLEDNPLGRSILFSQARKRALRESRGNYPAVPAILDCVETGYKRGVDAGYERELELFEPLLLSPESRAMRGLFFAVTENKKTPHPDLVRPVQTLAVVGAGFMGAGIAEVSLMQDMEVVLKDIREDVLANARSAMWRELEKKVRYHALTPIEAEETLGRLRGQLSYEGFDQVDLAIEAVVERMDVKQIVIADILAKARNDMILASNTSSLSITEMAEATDRPECVIGMHYFSPVTRMPLLEIVRTAYTADWVLATGYAVGIRQGKTCIVVKDSPGFYVNRILAPYMNEALLLLDEGAGIDAIDRALQQKGFPVGPLRLFDEVGLDIASHVVQSSETLFAHRPGFVVSRAVVAMHEAGRLGKKNGSGFYRYDKRKSRRRGVDPTAYTFFKGKGDATWAVDVLQDRPLMLMLNEAVRCLAEGVIEKAVDGDLGAVMGIGFPPFTGGPFRYIDAAGAAAVVSRMEELQQTYGRRFEPVPRLRDMAAQGARFYPT
ncbi:MAG: 3-hydroxyacyl-CoA dehydrogenase NAD-binding domain-containing protein [Rhodothermales bacterium]